jgi:uncharacterized protein (DUF885 family)
MLNRRQMLASAAGACLIPPAALAAADVSESERRSDAGAQLDELFDRFMHEDLLRSPELATHLGLDKGDLASQKSRLDDRSLARREADKQETYRRQVALAAIDRKALSRSQALGYDTIAYVQDVTAQADRRFAWGGPGAGSPYVVSQLQGAYLEIPDFLDTQHAIETRADAEAYLARLAALGGAMDQETEKIRHDAGLGVAPPAFVIDAALRQMGDFARTPADQSTLVASLVRRTHDKGLPGDYAAAATRLYETQVLPALGRQMEQLGSLRPRANPVAGVGGLPDGEDYYPLALKTWITTDASPSDVHRLGLDQVARLTTELDGVLRAQGRVEGPVWMRLRALFADRRYLYPNTDAGKAQLIADLNVKVAAVRARLPAWFGALPKADVQIRRVPPAIEAGASSNYQPGTLDGSRPGAYYIVLRDTAEDPSWLLPTLTYHEAIPGHHLQMSLQQESTLPLLRKTTWFSAYGEGWALYAEQLADEMGMYADDPFGRIGYLHDALLRAARMVMDTGLHAMGWTRAQAVRYFVENQGDPESAAISEVERYCCWPGQACSYMVGKLEWLRLRAKAKAALGERFDIRRFHDAGLLNGALPLTLLASAIDGYIGRAS